MRSELTILAIAGLLVLPLGGCRVQQTEEGDMPDVDVEARGGEMPEYEVEPAEIEIKGEKKTIKVPTDIDVTMEEREIIVPDVDVRRPGEPDEDDQEEAREDLDEPDRI